VSLKDEWGTPASIFLPINLVFDFTGDAAASKGNAWCPLYFTKQDNGLIQPWSKIGPRVWNNPPFSGSQIKKWVEKAISETENGITSVQLIPSDTSVNHWARLAKCLRTRIVYCTPGRIHHVQPPRKDGKKNSPAFPSAVVVHTPEEHHGERTFYWDRRHEPFPIR
jgi:phage N-6-adenine-methyltransferase